MKLMNLHPAYSKRLVLNFYLSKDQMFESDNGEHHLIEEFVESRYGDVRYSYSTEDYWLGIVDDDSFFNLVCIKAVAEEAENRNYACFLGGEIEAEKAPWALKPEMLFEVKERDLLYHLEVMAQDKEGADWLRYQLQLGEILEAWYLIQPKDVLVTGGKGSSIRGEVIEVGKDNIAIKMLDTGSMRLIERAALIKYGHVFTLYEKESLELVPRDQVFIPGVFRALPSSEVMLNARLEKSFKDLPETW